MVRFTICIVIFAILSPLIIADNPCRFESAGNGVIDISSLSHTDGKAAFPDLTPQQGSGYKYSYNPCQPFSEGDTCKNVAACQVSLDGQFTFILGTQDSATWNAGSPGNNPTISYSANPKQVQVELVCAEGSPGNVDAIGEGPENYYKFRLTGKCACWNGCKGAAPPSKGGSSFPIGAIFLIVIAALAVIYLTVFAAYNRFRHQRSGVDLIAHRTFWVAVPVYAKDGIRFLFYKVTGKGAPTYQSV